MCGILQLPKVFDSEVDHFPNCKSRPAEVEALLKYVSVGCNINTRTLAHAARIIRTGTQHELCFISKGVIFKYIRSKLRDIVKI